MSSKGLVQHNANHVIGMANDQKQIIMAPRSEQEELDVCFSNTDASWGNVSCVDIHLDPNQENIIDDCVWNFEFKNNSLTDTFTIVNPLYFLYSLEAKVNNAKVFELSGPEEIKAKILDYYMRYSADDEEVRRKFYHDIGHHTSGWSNPSYPANNTYRVECSMIPLLDELLAEHRSRKTAKISLVLKFRPNSNDPITIQRFIKNDTNDANPLSSSELLNHKLVLYLKRFASDAVQKTPSHTEVLRLADVEETTGVDFSTPNTLKYKMSDFAERKKISHVTTYAYNDSVAAYNSSNALVHEASPGFWRANVKRGGKVYKELDSTARVVREFNSYMKSATGSYNHHDLASGLITSRFPTFVINFSNLRNAHSEHAEIIDGINNKVSRDYDITLSNAFNGANNYTVVRVAHYQELLHIDDSGKVVVEA